MWPVIELARLASSPSELQCTDTSVHGGRDHTERIWWSVRSVVIALSLMRVLILIVCVRARSVCACVCECVCE